MGGRLWSSNRQQASFLPCKHKACINPHIFPQAKGKVQINSQMSRGFACCLDLKFAGLEVWSMHSVMTGPIHNTSFIFRFPSWGEKFHNQPCTVIWGSEVHTLWRLHFSIFTCLFISEGFYLFMYFLATWNTQLWHIVGKQLPVPTFSRHRAAFAFILGLVYVHKLSKFGSEHVQCLLWSCLAQNSSKT